MSFTSWDPSGIGPETAPSRFVATPQARVPQAVAPRSTGYRAVAAELPLERAAEALRLAESRTVVGKVVLRPDADQTA